MQEDIGKVMTAGLKPIKLAIYHVGNERQRMPIVRIAIEERAAKAVPGQSAANQRIAVDVNFVVETDEIVPEGLSKNGPNQNHNRAADSKLYRP